MPRFHFQVHDGSDIPDPNGTELRDLDAARREAAKLAGQLLADKPDEFWREGAWRIEVTDDAGLALFTVHVLGTYAPAGRRGK